MQELDFSSASSYFDFKSFLVKVLHYWYLFVLFLLICFTIAYYVSQRTIPVYKLSSLISINEDQNPLFTNSNTSLTFNWGGQSNIIGSTVMTLKTRSHNENVVKHLQYYLQYLQDGKYQKLDAYNKTPFLIKVKSDAYQLKNKLMSIRLLDKKKFEIAFEIEEDFEHLEYFNYKQEKATTKRYSSGKYLETFDVGKPIESKFFTGQLDMIDSRYNNEVYYIKFLDFNAVVKKYQDIYIKTSENGSSVITLELIGENKDKLVEYLNTTTSILSKTQLELKNLFATNTIKFIDSTLSDKATELEAFENELNDYKIKNEIIDLDSESENLKNKLITLDIENKNLKRQIEYLNTLKNYLNNHNTYEDPPAPSIAGITEGSLVDGVRKIVELSLERSKYQFTAKPDLPTFKDIDRQIDATKIVLQENIESSKKNLYIEINEVEKDLRKVERDVRKLPKNQQELLKIERRFNISQQTYDLFLTKRNEAKLIKASNVSDIRIIDEAKDVGDKKIGPNNKLNYVLALFFGLGIPLFIIFIFVLLDNKVSAPSDLEKLTTLPLIGVIGKSNLKSDTAILQNPNSIIAESFRGLRTSLQFVFNNNKIKGSKVILVTSSISGEGKTFSAINLASVLAMSGKKTILVGLDLRKPKIHNSFPVNKDLGVSNILSGQLNLIDAIQHTEHNNLFILASGVIPPNPSELLLTEDMDKMIEELKQSYDYVILDTPPIGLVSDALILMNYANATLYVVRQNYTKKGMLKLINKSYDKGEVKNVSLILNYFKAKSPYGYGYGNAYSYGSYGNHYIEKKQKNKKFTSWF